MEQFVESRAVVIGGSVAGLLAAAALSPHYAEVILLEPRVLAAAPQSKHVHGLLSSGWEAMRDLLPGLEARLSAAGATWVDFGNEFRWKHFGEDKAKFSEPMLGPFASRVGMQSAIREEVLALPNVRHVEDKVCGYLGGIDCLDGLVLASGDELLAELVVDASGRNSLSPGCLEALGLGPIPEESYTVDLKYCSMKFRRTEAAQAPDWKALFVIPEPPLSHSGGIFPQEGGEFLVTLSGRGDDEMPRNEAEFGAFAGLVEDAEFQQQLAQMEACSELSHYRFPRTLRRRYDRVKSPANLYVLGDALCSLNPLFGQGMSLCAIAARELGRCVRLGKTQGSSKAFYKRVCPIVDQAWQMTMLEDMRYPQWEGKRRVLTRFLQWYTRRLYRVSAQDGAVNQQLYQVIHLHKPALALFEPRVLGRVLTYCVSGFASGG